MVLQQALELRIEVLVVANALDVVTLDHPLDVQRGYGHAQCIVLEYLGCDRLRWANHETHGAKPVFKFLSETLEQLDMLRFLAGELQQRAHSVIIALKLWPGVVQYEGENELLDESEDA